MKNEEKILELLAEYLLKTDRSLERIEVLQKQTHELQSETRELQKQTHELQKQSLELQKQSLELQKETIELRKEAVELRKETSDLRKETSDLRRESLKHEIKNDVLLKEILSISRRVITLEEKNDLFGRESGS